MNLIIDLDEHQVITDFTNSNPVNPISIKSQDTPLFAVYFVQRGVNYDLGSAPGIRFGLFQPGNPNPLVQCSSFVRALDFSQRVCYRGYPNFNTTALAGAIGINTTLACLGEFRYQTTGGTIARTADVTFNVNRVLLSETIIDNTTAAFITPAVGSTVSIAISSTTWLKSGLIVSIGAGAGNYTVTSITDATHFVAQNNGGTGNAAPGTSIPVGTTVGIAPATIISTYPDPSVIEITPHKGAANGYAGLDANTLLLATQVPVDGQTISALPNGKIGSSSILATVAANFITPAANANVSVTLNSTANLKSGTYVRIPIAGYYIVETITDGTHAVLQNNGDPFNAAAGVTITAGAVLLPAQAAAGGGGGTPGQNAFSTITASFTVPAAGATVTVAMGSTAWLGGSGYVVFVQNAGYYAVSSVTDSTHAVLTNLGYATTNAGAGTTIPNGSQVSPGGIQGAASSATGANAYDTTTASFTMPAAAANVNVTISNTGWLGVGQVVYIAGAGYFTVASITSATVFNATNANYPGAAAPGSTIASGAHVSPAGLIGPAGAGGAGLNAFTSLSANFTQPAGSANVTITVGTTAWMALGQIIYVVGGGYYTISSIGDVTHVTVTNLGYLGNATSGATVSSGGAVSPAGLIGPAGSTPYTTTTLSFTMPASGASVTVTVGTTAFMVAGQNVYVQGAGYFTIASVTDSTHVVLTNSGTTGNISSGTTIASGAGISVAGATGPAVNVSGGFSNAADAGGAAGAGETSLIASIASNILNLKKLKSGPAGSVALTDQGGSTGDVLVDVPVDGTTITVVSGKLTASGGGGGAFDPRTGLYFYDDFLTTQLNNNIWSQASNGGGGATVGQSGYGYDSTRKSNGIAELATGTGTTGTFAQVGGGVVNGYLTTNTQGSGIVLGAGTIDLAVRLAIEEATLPVTGVGYTIRVGFITQNSTISAGFPGGNQPNTSCVVMEYSPDQNSGNFRIGSCFNTTSGNTYVNCTGTPVANTYGWWELKITSAGVCTAYFNGASIGSTTLSGSLLGILLCPYVIFWRNNSAGTGYHVAVDTFFYNYPYTR